MRAYPQTCGERPADLEHSLNFVAARAVQVSSVSQPFGFVRIRRTRHSWQPLLKYDLGFFPIPYSPRSAATALKIGVARGCDLAVLSELLPAAEAGLVEVLAKRRPISPASPVSRPGELYPLVITLRGPGRFPGPLRLRAARAAYPHP
jgi:hypothetical protein